MLQNFKVVLFRLSYVSLKSEQQTTTFYYLSVNVYDIVFVSYLWETLIVMKWHSLTLLVLLCFHFLLLSPFLKNSISNNIILCRVDSIEIIINCIIHVHVLRKLRVMQITCPKIYTECLITF